MSRYILCDLWFSKRNVSCGSAQRTHSKKFPWDGLVRRSRESFVGVLERFVRAQSLRRGSRESIVGALERLVRAQGLRRWSRENIVGVLERLVRAQGLRRGNYVVLLDSIGISVWAHSRI